MTHERLSAETAWVSREKRKAEVLALSLDQIEAIIASSEVILRREPSRTAAVLGGMRLIRERLVFDKTVAPDALVAISSYVRRLEAHVRRGSKTSLQLIVEKID